MLVVRSQLGVKQRYSGAHYGDAAAAADSAMPNTIDGCSYQPDAVRKRPCNRPDQVYR
jgi:hypothetical protein